MKKITLVVLALVTGILASTAQVTLSFNPAKGATYQYSMDMNQKIKQNLMGQDLDMDQKMVMTYDMKVVENNKTEIKTIFSYTHVYYELVNPMMNMKYDSRNAENLTGMDAMMGKIFNSLLGKEFEVVILPNGTVKSVSGMDAIIEDMMEAVGGDMMAQQMGESMKAQFSNEAMKTSFEQSFKIYPASSVKVGDSWNVEQSTNANGVSMDIKSVYTLKAINNKKATIEIQSDIQGVEGQLSGTQGGELILDTITGLPEKAALTQSLKGTVSANGMEVIVAIESEILTSTMKK